MRRDGPNWTDGQAVAGVIEHGDGEMKRREGVKVRGRRRRMCGVNEKRTSFVDGRRRKWWNSKKRQSRM